MRRARIVELSMAMSLALVSGVVAFLCLPLELSSAPRHGPAARQAASNERDSAAPSPDTAAPETRISRAFAPGARGRTSRPGSVRAAPRPDGPDDVEALLVLPNGLVLGDPWLARAVPVGAPTGPDVACELATDTDELFAAMLAPAERDVDGAGDVLFLLGVARHAVLDLASAADYYEAFAEHDASRDAEECSDAERASGRCVNAPLALERAVELRVALGDDARALDLAHRYVETYAETRVEDAARMSTEMGLILARRDPEGAAVHLAAHTRRFSRHVPPPVALRAHVDRGRAEWRAGHRDQAARSFRRALRVWQRGASDVAALAPDTDGREFTETLEAAAEAGYYLAELRHQAFEAILTPAYEGDGSRADVARWARGALRPAVLRKVRALRDAERAYRTVVALGVTRHRVAALARTGEMYRALADAFERAPLPVVHEVNELDVSLAPDDWRKRPRERLASRALEAFESCLAAAISSRMYVDDARTCGAALSELAEERYPRQVELAPRALRVHEKPLAPTPAAAPRVAIVDRQCAG